jgi:hypothetical protein
MNAVLKINQRLPFPLRLPKCTRERVAQKLATEVATAKARCGTLRDAGAAFAYGRCSLAGAAFFALLGCASALT